MYFSVSSHRGRINEPGVEDAGEREGNIERVRQQKMKKEDAGMLRVPVAPFFRACPPGEGRTVTRGVRHAQHRLLDVEVMMLVINWRCAL